MTVTTAADSLAELAAATPVLWPCECGQPAGPDPVRCSECAAPLCPACATPDRPDDGPVDLCYRCALAILAGADLETLELADELLEEAHRA
jgi:hypothetical protein